MEKCKRCGIKKDAYSNLNGKSYCLDCIEELRNQRIEQAVKEANEPASYKTFSESDLADAFWNALGRYKKRPNKTDLKRMNDMWLWACHDSHAQSTNFSRALKWCNIDLWIEKKRTDIPEE